MGTKKTVSIHEAKTNLSKLIQEALDGTEIIIAKSKKPLIKLVVLEEGPHAALSLLGKYNGKAKISKDFDQPIDDFKDYM